MNRLDQFIATNICTLFLLGVSSSFFYLAVNTDRVPKLFILIISLAILFFNLRLIKRYQERNKLFTHLEKRIRSDGYRKEIFKGRCPTVCSFFLCLYIILRMNRLSDGKFLWRQFMSKKSYPVHADPEIQKAIIKALNEIQL